MMSGWRWQLERQYSSQSIQNTEQQQKTFQNIAYFDVKFQIFIHLINVAENVAHNTRNDALHVRITENSLQ